MYDMPYMYMFSVDILSKRQKQSGVLKQGTERAQAMNDNDLAELRADIKVMTTTEHTLQWRHNGRDSDSNHQPHDCLLNSLFKRRSKKASMLCITGLCAGNSPGTSEFPAQMACNTENASIWWRHHEWVLHKMADFYFNSSDAGDRIFQVVWSIPCLLMPWLLKSSEHQQAWYWQYRISNM